MTTFPAREWAAAAALAAIALAVLAFGRPAVTTASEQVDVQHSAELSYSAQVGTPRVYSGNRIRTGDPVFLSVASTIDTHLDYDLGFEPEGVTGTIRSRAKLSASNGWEREVPLGAAKIEGNHLERSLPVDFAGLLKTVHTAEQRTGTTFGSYTLEVIHDVDVQGTVAGQRVTTSSSPKLTFALDDQQAVLQGDPPAAIGKPVTMTEPTSVAVSGSAPATVTVLKWDVPVSVLRMLAIALGVVSLALASLAMTGASARKKPHAVFGDRIVPASNLDFGDRSVVDVDDAEALARIATLYDTVVLHVAGSRTHLFLVLIDQTIYRYAEPSTGEEELVTKDHARATETNNHISTS